MPQATITVAGIMPPAMGKKQGHIIDTTGGKWNVWGDKLHNYRDGVTYNIVYEENEFKGIKFFVIKNADPAGAAASAMAAGGQLPLAQPPSPLGYAPQPSPAAASQSVMTDKDRQIWVNALLGRCLNNPNTDPFNLERDKIAEKAKLFYDLYDYLFGPKPKAPGQQRRDDMNDEIPF